MAPSLRRIVARELQRIWNRPDDESVTPIITARHALQHVNLRVEDSALLLALTVAIQLREVGQDFGEYAGLTATDDDVRILTSQRKRYADLAVFSLTWIISVLAGVVGYHFYLVLQSGGLGGECRAFGG
ncbi:hypothetical protein FA95DRAFT_584367 [Auriscalpium vulgare]|uniref:Uncharacterized protein n=1 Tax=Auriscalpium vulgare TaxID=40419 RepID=A0ACB8RDV8_9AGAM|nr:hypothetical protein FA95DRAFT_584367 [Auriscalpium vulgare]